MNSMNSNELAEMPPEVLAEMRRLLAANLPWTKDYVSREDFLALDLLPTANAISKDEDCPICMAQYDDPVELPCTHVFDRACIVEWLGMRGQNKCPLCKVEFFKVPPEEQGEEIPSNEEQVLRAMQHSGIHTGEPETYGSDLEFLTVELWNAADDAGDYLLRDEHERPVPGSRVLELGMGLTVAGPAVIDFKSLALHLIVIANLLPEWLSVRGGGLTEQQRADWKLCIQTLLPILKKNDGKKYDALTMGHELRNLMKKELESRRSDACPIEFLFPIGNPEFYHEEMYGDMTFLLNYVTWQCWLVQRNRQLAADREHARRKEQRREALRKFLKKPSCAVM